MPLPKLDKLPSGHPRNDWNYNRIRQLKGLAAACPDEWENPFIKEVVLRDQGDRGTCTGVSGANGADLNYIKLRSPPTPDDKSSYKKDVKEATGTVHDTLYKTSFSGECMYQGGRDVGNVDYPEGGELRWNVKFWRDTGMVLEKDWFTAKNPQCVVKEPPNKQAAQEFAKGHKIDGWAVVDNNFDSVCQAIYEKGWCWIGIPVFASYEQMSGGDGWFPDKFNGIVGGHALCAYGYSKTGKTSRQGIKVYHTWDGYCNPYGGYSKEYFDRTVNDSDYFVILDSSEVEIGKQAYWSLTVTAKDYKTHNPIPAKISVDGKLLGPSPQKFAVEQGGKYTITAELSGYKPLKHAYRMTAKKKSSLTLSLLLKAGGRS